MYSSTSLTSIKCQAHKISAHGHQNKAQKKRHTVTDVLDEIDVLEEVDVSEVVEELVDVVPVPVAVPSVLVLVAPVAVLDTDDEPDSGSSPTPTTPGS